MTYAIYGVCFGYLGENTLKWYKSHSRNVQIQKAPIHDQCTGAKDETTCYGNNMRNDTYSLHTIPYGVSLVIVIYSINISFIIS